MFVIKVDLAQTLRVAKLFTRSAFRLFYKMLWTSPASRSRNITTLVTSNCYFTYLCLWSAVQFWSKWCRLKETEGPLFRWACICVATQSELGAFVCCTPWSAGADVQFDFLPSRKWLKVWIIDNCLRHGGQACTDTSNLPNCPQARWLSVWLTGNAADYLHSYMVVCWTFD